eukprot:365190-Chlamydomonas_euryale.AAC.10
MSSSSTSSRSWNPTPCRAAAAAAATARTARPGRRPPACPRRRRRRGRQAVGSRTPSRAATAAAASALLPRAPSRKKPQTGSPAEHAAERVGKGLGAASQAPTPPSLNLRYAPAPACKSLLSQCHSNTRAVHRPPWTVGTRSIPHVPPVCTHAAPDSTTHNTTDTRNTPHAYSFTVQAGMCDVAPTCSIEKKRPNIRRRKLSGSSSSTMGTPNGAAWPPAAPLPPPPSSGPSAARSCACSAASSCTNTHGWLRSAASSQPSSATSSAFHCANPSSDCPYTNATNANCSSPSSGTISEP